MIIKYPKLAFAGAIFSTIILTSFPLITQLYLRYLYKQSSLSLLLYVTLFFAFLFVIKIFIDIFVEKKKFKYYLKVEKDIKERIFEKYKNDIKSLLHDKSDLFSTHLSTYMLYLRTKQENILDIVRILLVAVILFFYDRHLFFYVIYAIPFLAIFYVFSKRLELSKRKEAKTEDFGVVLLKASNLPEKLARYTLVSHLEAVFRKRTYNRYKALPLKVTMHSFLSFFRLCYLAYFGYYAITSFLDMTGLIVGLLYLTLFIRPCIHLIETSFVYTISKTSRRKIYALYS
jgi:hypothetical protein